MTNTATYKKLASYGGYNPPMRNAIMKLIAMPGRFFHLILHAMHESRRRQAEREIANFVARQGGHITDDLEREMTHRLFTSDWGLQGQQPVKPFTHSRLR